MLVRIAFLENCEILKNENGELILNVEVEEGNEDNLIGLLNVRPGSSLEDFEKFEEEADEEMGIILNEEYVGSSVLVSLDDCDECDCDCDCGECNCDCDDCDCEEEDEEEDVQ
jgi:hypothetical protein